MQKRFWDDDDTALLKLWHAEGMTLKSIAKEMDWSNKTIETKLKDLGLSRYLKWDDEKYNQLKELVAQGLTSKEIAVIFKCGEDAIKSRRVIAGLSTRRGVNNVSDEKFKEYVDTLTSKNMLIGVYAGVKGNSLIQCTKCESAWHSRIADIVRRDQPCPVCTPKTTSKIAMAWLDELNINTREYKIPGTRFHADGYDESTNTIYEFLGDYWHGNPDVFDPNEVHPTIGTTYAELHQTTVVDRFNKLKELGYNIVYIWEKDYKSAKIPQIWQ